MLYVVVYATVHSLKWRRLMNLFAVQWIWSTVFHARDSPWTERLDYYCATFLIYFRYEFVFGGKPQWGRGSNGSPICSCLSTLAHIFRIYKLGLQIGVLSVLMLGCCSHVFYLEVGFLVQVCLWKRPHSIPCNSLSSLTTASTCW